jgi:hypothetical protein
VKLGRHRDERFQLAQLHVSTHRPEYYLAH